METMNRMSNMPPDSEAKDKVSLWLVTLGHPVYSVYLVKSHASSVQDGKYYFSQCHSYLF